MLKKRKYTTEGYDSTQVFFSTFAITKLSFIRKNPTFSDISKENTYWLIQVTTNYVYL